MNRFHLTTSSPVMTQDFFESEDSVNKDLVLRIRRLDDKTCTLTSTNTQAMRNDLNAYVFQHSQDIDLLRSVIFWQKRTIDYQALHTAFLLNSLSEEEFEQESDKFTVHQVKIPPEKIAFDIGRIDSLLGLKFDTSDYSDYFQCSQENVMDGLRLLPYTRFIAMLPASD